MDGPGQWQQLCPIKPEIMRTPITLALALIALAPLRAQENCNDVFPESITFNPFDSSLIEIRMVNNGPIGWSYPSLVFYNANDSIAWAPAEYFALGNDQVFTLQTMDGVTIPTGPFYGKVELWTGFNDSLRCTWYPEPFLCPPTECAVVHPYALVSTGNASGMQFTWTVADELQQTIATGEMTVPEGSVEAQDSVCLTPGHYTLNIFNPWINGEGVYFSMRGQAWNTTSSQQVELSTGDGSTFTLLEACIDQGNAISEHAASRVRVNISNEMLHIRREDGRAFDSIEVIDASGKRIHVPHSISSSVDVPLNAVAPGLLLVRTWADGTIGTERVMWTR